MNILVIPVDVLDAADNVDTDLSALQLHYSKQYKAGLPLENGVVVEDLNKVLHTLNENDTQFYYKPVLTIPDGIKHPHYYKDVSDIDVIDVYVVLHRFGVTDPCLQHLIKKALCTGNRGHKDFLHDLQDIADTAQRALEIHQPK